MRGEQHHPREWSTEFNAVLAKGSDDLKAISEIETCWNPNREVNFRWRWLL